MANATKNINVTELKVAARGRWLEIFRSLAGVELDGNAKRHGPCPKCGGTDRFRVIDAAAGALYCNQCFSAKNGDGIAALSWLTEKSFKDTVASLCEYLGVSPKHKAKGKPEKPRVFVTSQGLVRYFLESLAKAHGGPARLTRVWRYDTFSVLRFDIPTPAGAKQRKEFRPVHQIALGLEGGKGWQCGYPAGPRPIYRRQEVERAPGDLITIHGGEKAADAAAVLGLAATTNAGGEKAMDHTDWSPVFRFATIAIVVDNDPAGEAFGQILAAKFRRAKADIDVRIVRLPGLPEKGDVVEWIADGGTLDQFRQIVATTAKATALELDPEAADDDPHRLAQVFLKEHCPYKELVYWRGEYWCWDTYYRPLYNQDLRSDVTRAIKAEFDRINVERQLESTVKGGSKQNGEEGEEGDRVRKVQRVTRRLVSDVINALESTIKLSGSIDQQTWIDGTQRPNCVVVENCILDLDAFVSRKIDWNLPHTPKWFSPIFLPYPVDITCEKCKSPLWDTFLIRAMDGDVKRIATIQEWFGYCLTHDTSMQRFLLLEGEGGGGKSTLCAALIALLGRQNVSHVPLERFGDKFTLSTTLGKLANIAAECGDLDKAAEGFLKSFTSGDRMLFEKKMQQPFSAMPTARLVLATNNRPRFSDRSTGLWRRMLVIPFNANFADGGTRVTGMDKPEFWERSGELPGIFWWAVLGLHRLREQGEFTVSETSQAAIEDYRLETNPARCFLIDHCQASDFQTTSCADLYSAYSRWCKSKGYHSLGEKQFGKEVFRVFPKSKRRRVGGRGDRFYIYDGLDAEIADFENS